MNCTATVRQAGDVAIIDLAGRVANHDGAAVITSAIRNQVETGRKNILLNLSGIEYVDSSGMGAMAEAYITVSRLGGQVKLLKPRARVNSMLQVANLYQVLVTFSDEAEALASF